MRQEYGEAIIVILPCVSYKMVGITWDQLIRAENITVGRLLELR